MVEMCFDCIHRNIQETSYEWIECHCKKDGEWHNPYRGCENHETDKSETDKM